MPAGSRRYSRQGRRLERPLDPRRPQRGVIVVLPEPREARRVRPVDLLILGGIAHIAQGKEETERAPEIILPRDVVVEPLWPVVVGPGLETRAGDRIAALDAA